MKTAIYTIINLFNGKQYIGSSKNWRNRRNQHLSRLRRGIHANSHLQNAFDKYGNVFIWHVVESVQPEQLIEREQFWINALNVIDNGDVYNIAIKAGESPMLGRKQSPEHIKKRADAIRGCKQTPEHIRKRIDPLRGRQGKKHTSESKKKIADAQRGKKGRPMTQEHKAIIAEANRKRIISEATRLKLSEASRKRHAANRAAKHQLSKLSDIVGEPE